MKRLVKAMAIILAMAVFVVLAGCTKKKNHPEVGIIQYMEHVALDSAREGFITALRDNGYVEGENITFDIQNAQGDQTNLSTISDRFVSNNVDLVLAIATPRQVNRQENLENSYSLEQYYIMLTPD